MKANTHTYKAKRAVIDYIVSNTETRKDIDTFDVDTRIEADNQPQKKH